MSSSPVAPLWMAPSLRIRLACWLYEGMLLFGVVFVAGFVFSTLARADHALAHRQGLQAVVFLVMGIYFSGFWSRGQTLAMKTWRIRLVDRQGQRVSAWRAMVRYLLSWLWILPPMAISGPLQLPALEVLVLTVGWILIWALLSRFHPERQYWHDVWAGTRLIPVALSPK